MSPPPQSCVRLCIHAVCLPVCVLRLAQMCRVHPSDITAINNPHAVYILGIGINCASQFEIRMGFFFFSWQAELIYIVLSVLSYTGIYW